MNGSQEHPDVPMQPQTPPAAPPPPPTQAAPPLPVASPAVSGAAAGRVQGLQHKTPFIARPEADSFERPTALLDEFLPH